MLRTILVKDCIVVRVENQRKLMQERRNMKEEFDDFIETNMTIYSLI